jgi:hypothetical protein
MKARRRIRATGPSPRRAKRDSVRSVRHVRGKSGGSARKDSSLFRQRIDQRLPARAKVLVLSRGNEDLIRFKRCRGAHFPQDASGRCARYDPINSAGAIAHLEALRFQGSEFLILPSTENWWRDTYPEFIRYLQRRYALTDQTAELGAIYSLREKSPWRDFEDAVSEFRIDHDREPTVLNWDSELHIGELFPECRWFQPPSVKSDRLPYLDRSIDFVAMSAGDAARMKQARRIATAGVIVADRSAEPNSKPAVFVERFSTSQEKQRPSISMVVAQGDVDLPLKRRLALLHETIPAGLHYELLLHPISPSKAPALKKAKGDLVIFIGPNIQPLPGWLAPLLRLFDAKPNAGIVGGRIVNFDGTQNHIGGIAGANGRLDLLGAQEVDPASPGFGFVREVDFCATTFLATRRSLIADSALPRNFGGHDIAATAAFCSAARAQGLGVYFEPDSWAIAFSSAPAATDTRSTQPADVRTRRRATIHRARASNYASRNGSELS